MHADWSLKAKQKEEGHTNRNDRLIAVANQSLLYCETKTLKDLNPKVLQQVEAFFVNYQKFVALRSQSWDMPGRKRRCNSGQAGDRKKAA